MTGPGDGSPAAGPAAGPAVVGGVWLVGAGPGDPGLLTVRGRDLLAAADVVVTDRLAAASILEAVRPGAEVIGVGKSPTTRSRTQEEINEILVDRAGAGARVVRLKGGDPFVLGRGGEEAEACAAAGIPCVVVPGVTSALAAPAYAGIPVTHRGVAQDVAIVSGHLPPGHPESTVDWAALAASRSTIVILMGVARLMAIADALLAGGRPGATPVAVVERGATPAQRVLRTTLDALAIDAIAMGIRSPAVIVVGEVAAREDAPVPPIGVDVDLDHHLDHHQDHALDPEAGGSAGAGIPGAARAAGAAGSVASAGLVASAGSAGWGSRPLTGIRILVPRTRSRPGLLAGRLRRLGAEAVETIVSRPAAAGDGTGLVAALPGADRLLLADADEVAAIVTLLRRAGADVRALAGLALGAAGDEAAAALEALGLAVDRDDPPAAGPGVVIVGAAAPPSEAREVRRVNLLADLVAPPDPRIAEELRHGDFDIAAFASSTAARSTAELYRTLPPDLLVAAMGRRTVLACEEAGMRVDIVPTEPGVHPLASAIAEFVRSSRSPNAAR